MADFNKHFSGHTVITSGAAGLIAGLSSKHVLLEDPRFNQSFTVYASDQVEARYLLTPSLMELLLKLEARLGSFQVSFVDSWINIAASLPYNYFEPDLKVPLNNIAQVKQILYAIYNVVSIVDTLDLNTRIWSKE